MIHIFAIQESSFPGLPVPQGLAKAMSGDSTTFQPTRCSSAALWRCKRQDLAKNKEKGILLLGFSKQGSYQMGANLLCVFLKSIQFLTFALDICSLERPDVTRSQWANLLSVTFPVPLTAADLVLR